jgi:hypothetical protein
MYLLFVAGIMFLVVKSSQQQVDLVTPDYYAEELRYQDRIDETRRAQALEEPLQFAIEHDVLTLTFPKQFEGKSVKGNVLLYCPSNKDHDLSRNLDLVDNRMKITIPERNTGLHEVQVSWEADGVKYYFGKNVFVN